MANHTKMNLTLLVLIAASIFTRIQCENDVSVEVDDAEDSEDINEEQGYTNLEPDRIVKEEETDLEDTNRTTVTDDYNSTTETTSVWDDDSRVDDDSNRRSVVGDDVITSEATEATVATVSSPNNDNNKQTDIVDEDTNVNRRHSDQTPPTETPDAPDDIVPRIAELGAETDYQGLRSPKTESADPQPNERLPSNPQPAPAAEDQVTTLRGWLEDSWLRSPVGVLVPLRPAAIARARAVWRELAQADLNVTDLVIVGYDANGISWRSRHNLQVYRHHQGERAVGQALSKLLVKYKGIKSDTGDSTMRALTAAAKLVPYDSALFVVTDRAAGDPEKLPLALRALIQKRLKVYTIWTDPEHPSPESEAALSDLRNVSQHTEGDVLPYSPDVDLNSLEDQTEDQHSMRAFGPARRSRLYQDSMEKFETLLVRRGGGEAISLGVPVENGVTALRVYIEGAVEHAVLYPPNDAPQIDLYNKTSVSDFSPSSRIEGSTPRDVLLVFPGSEAVTDMLSVIPASTPPAYAGMVGTWHLSIRCNTCDYRLEISARATLHFSVEDESQDMLKFRLTGPVSSVRESVLVDEYGTELAKLSYSYTSMSNQEEEVNENPSAELTADVIIPRVKGSRVFAKIVGRDNKGEPFVRFAGPLIHQSESRTSRSASLVFPDAKTDLDRAEEDNTRIYNARIQYNDTNVVPYNRAMSQVNAANVNKT